MVIKKTTTVARASLLVLGLIAMSTDSMGAETGRVVCGSGETAGRAVTSLNSQIRSRASSTSAPASAEAIEAHTLSAPALVVTPEGSVIVCVTSQSKAH